MDKYLHDDTPTRTRVELAWLASQIGPEPDAVGVTTIRDLLGGYVSRGKRMSPRDATTPSIDFVRDVTWVRGLTRDPGLTPVVTIAGWMEAPNQYTLVTTRGETTALAAPGDRTVVRDAASVGEALAAHAQFVARLHRYAPTDPRDHVTIPPDLAPAISAFEARLSAPDRFWHGGLVKIDRLGRIAFRGGQPVTLGRAEFALLETLLTHEGSEVEGDVLKTEIERELQAPVWRYRVFQLAKNLRRRLPGIPLVTVDGNRLKLER